MSLEIGEGDVLEEALGDGGGLEGGSRFLNDGNHFTDESMILIDKVTDRREPKKYPTRYVRVFGPHTCSLYQTLS